MMNPTRVLLARSAWKGPHIVPLPIPSRIKPGEKIAPIRTQARAATILPAFVGLKFQVHNGKNYIDVTITEDMVGHKLGEFAPYVVEDTLFKSTKAAIYDAEDEKTLLVQAEQKQMSA